MVSEDPPVPPTNADSASGDLPSGGPPLSVDPQGRAATPPGEQPSSPELAAAAVEQAIALTREVSDRLAAAQVTLTASRNAACDAAGDVANPI